MFPELAQPIKQLQLKIAGLYLDLEKNKGELHVRKKK